MQFIWTFDIEPKNRGWVVDKLSCIIYGEEAGYIKVENLPKKNFDRIYTDIFQYVSNLEGHCFYVGRENIKKNLSYQNLVDIIQTTINWHYDFEGETYDRLMFVIESYLHNRYAKKFLQFKERHVDNPFPAYIRVNLKYQRRGIAIELYKEAAKEYARRGLVLRASTLNTAEGLGVLKKLENMGLMEFNSEKGYYQWAA